MQTKLNAFFAGIGSIMNLSGNYYNIGKNDKNLSAAAIDAEAIASDWQAVGDDIRNAVRVFKNEHTEKEK